MYCTLAKRVLEGYTEVICMICQSVFPSCNVSAKTTFISRQEKTLLDMISIGHSSVLWPLMQLCKGFVSC